MGNHLHSTSLASWLDLAPWPWLIGDAQTWVELGEIYQPNALALPSFALRTPEIIHARACARAQSRPWSKPAGEISPAYSMPRRTQLEPPMALQAWRKEVGLERWVVTQCVGGGAPGFRKRFSIRIPSHSLRTFSHDAVRYVSHLALQTRV